VAIDPALILLNFIMQPHRSNFCNADMTLIAHFRPMLKNTGALTRERKWLAGRVTKLGDFSPNGLLFTMGVF
jgi:hypothetical protein